ncbi:unnamed protein product [Rhizoctonia solani]|uniref:Protein kinase domain-containing protein n=1 Tax=Rhizoctonia solani TaxID=456999 RepID=A0A8H2XV07_9AGAM|nr:unnamed protein product [Rhizoctonia solani]
MLSSKTSVVLASNSEAQHKRRGDCTLVNLPVDENEIYKRRRMARLMREGAWYAPTTTYSKMAYSNYGIYPPVVVTSADDECQYYPNTLAHQGFGYGPAQAQWFQSAQPRVVDRMPTQDVRAYEGHISSRNLFPPRHDPGPILRQNLHVATDILPTSSPDMWSQGGSGVTLVQSPSSYLPPSPTVHGVPSIRRHKVAEITFDGVNYARVDLTRHSDPGAIRDDIISRLPPTARSFSSFDIFRTNPPGSVAALNDGELMLDIEHFGDDRATLKFLVRAIDGYSDSHLPTYARAATAPSSLNPPSPIHFPSPHLAPSPRSPIAGSDGWYGSDAPASGVSGYVHTPSRSSSNYSAYSPSINISMPIPMPAPSPMRQSVGPGAPAFPTPDYSVGYAPTPASSAPESSSAQPLSINPLQPKFRSNNATCKRPRPTSGCYGTTNLDGGIASGRDGGYQYGASKAAPRPKSVVIGGTMTTDEVLSHLYERGCENVANKLDESSISGNPVARGGGGDVYSGKFHTGKRVALKCIRLAIGNEDRSKLKRTAHELYVWSKCKHPNVLELIGVTHHRDQVAMVSPWVDGGDLLTFLRQHPGAGRYELCTQIVEGVAYLHSQTIVHGDIKGANVLISQGCVAKITDFGTSALKNYTLEFAATKTKPGLSIRWAAPEILENDADNSYEADVYALGMTILEAITGDLPYACIAKECAVVGQVLQKILPARPEVHILSDDLFGDHLWSLLCQCWTYEPRSRPTVNEVQQQMMSIVF